MAVVKFSAGGFYENVRDQKEESSPPWLHGQLERKEVEQVFSNFGNVEGSYLVRESTRNAGDFVLSLMCDGKVQHYMIQNSNDQYSIDDGPNFGSLHELIQYYQLNNERLPCKLEMACYRDVSGSAPVELPAPRMQHHAPLPSLPVHDDLPPLPSLSSAPSLPPARGSRAPAPPLPPSYDDDLPALPNLSISSAKTQAPATKTPSRGAPPPLPQDDDDEPLPSRPTGRTSLGAVTSPTGSRPGQMNIPENRAKLAEVPRVKKWLDAAQSVSQQHIEVRKEEDHRKLPEGFTTDAVRTAANRQAAFEQAALAEERMYLLWLNKQLKALGRPEVQDISNSLKNGILIIEVLKKISGMNPPIYAKKVVVVQQEVDNWISIVKYMRKLGIPVDQPEGYADGENVGLDPIALHNLDRREILKMFQKILIFEAQSM